LGSLTDEEITKTYWTLTKAERDYFGSLEEYIKHIKDPVAGLNEIFASAEKQILQYSGATISLHGNMTTDNVSAYANVIG
jgi:hypothetical protein